MIGVWKRRPILCTSLAAALLVVCYVSRSTTASSEACIKCLQTARCKEVRVLGIRISKTTKLTRGVGGIMDPATLGSTFRGGDPRIYRELFGVNCTHDFRMQGRCVYTFGLVACGGGGGFHCFRIEALEQLHLLYRRWPNKALAVRTYQFIDQRPPENDQARSDLFNLKDLLEIAASESDWEKALSLNQENAAALHSEFYSFDRLASLLKHTNAVIREEAFGYLSYGTNAATWQLIESLLEDQELGEGARSKVMNDHYFPLYPKVLKRAVFARREQAKDSDSRGRFNCWPYGWSNSQADAYSDEEIRTMLQLGDRYVDVYAFGVIAYRQKVHFLDEMIQVLNLRSSHQAIYAVRELLAGPDPWNSREPQHWQPEGRMPPSATNVWNTIANTPHFYYPVESVRNLSIPPRPDPASWNALKSAFEGPRTSPSASYGDANVALAMFECDPPRTIEWFIGELTAAADGNVYLDNRFRNLLVGAGAIAHPAFLPVLEKIVSLLKREQPQLSYGPLPFALHRCKGIHRWELRKDAEGAFFIFKSNETAG